MSQLYHLNFRAMGSQVNVLLEADADGKTRLQRLPEQVEAIEARLSRFRPHSELMALNAQAGSWVTTSETLFTVLQAARQAALRTGGLYNPLILPGLLANGYDRSFEQIDQPLAGEPGPAPDWRAIELRPRTREVRLPAGSAVDLGGIGKGWTAALMADDLAHAGPCMVDLGGDIAVRGRPSTLPGWPVDIQEPGSEAVLASLWLADTNIATSGTDYRRWTTQDGQARHHILDPRSGQPANTDLQAVTVIHPNAALAEAYTKAVLLQGAAAGLDWLNAQWNAAGLAVRYDGAVLATTTFTPLLQESLLEERILS